MLQHTFGEFHHPVVVLVLHIEFYTGKLRIVRAVHTFVTEILTDFVDTFKATHNETLEIKFCRNTAIHLLTQSVEVRDEGTRRSTARDVLECGSFYLSVARLIQDATHSSDHLCTLVESFLDVRIDNQVNIATAIAQFGIFESVKHFAILFFWTGKWLQTLCQKGQFAHVHRDFPCFGAEDETFHTDEVAQIEEFLHQRVVEGLVFFGADVIACDIHLDASTRIEKFEEGSLTHHATAHHATCDANLTGFVFIAEVFDDFIAKSVGGIFCCGIRVNAKGTNLIE